MRSAQVRGARVRPSTATVPARASSAAWFVRPVRRAESPPMRVAVIDVGSNTARLLVAEQGGRARSRIGEEKALPRARRGDRAAGHVGRREARRDGRGDAALRRARASSARRRSTSSSRRPAGRRGTRTELVATIARATGHFACVLSARGGGRARLRGRDRDDGGRPQPGRRVRRRRRLDRDHGRRPRARLVLAALGRPRLAAAHGDGARTTTRPRRRSSSPRPRSLARRPARAARRRRSSGARTGGTARARSRRWPGDAARRGDASARR